MGNVEVAWEDVVSVLNLIRGHIGALAVLLAAMVAAIAFAAVKLKKPLKGFVQWQSVIAFIALGAFVVNTMLTGPLYNTLSVVLSEAGELSAESIAESRRVVEEVTKSFPGTQKRRAVTSSAPPSGASSASSATYLGVSFEENKRLAR